MVLQTCSQLNSYTKLQSRDKMIQILRNVITAHFCFWPVEMLI